MRQTYHDGIAEDLDSIAEVELLVDNGRTVDLDTTESEGLLLLVQELGLAGASGEIPESEGGEEDGGSPLDDEEPPPRVERGVVDAEDGEGEQPGEGIGDVGRGVEDGQSTSQLTTTVEGGEVVDDQGEEGRLGHAQEPTQGEDAAEVGGGGGEKGHGAEREHEDGEDDGRAVFLSDETHEGGGEDEGDEEDHDDEVVLAILEVEIRAETRGFGVAQVALVQGIEEV